MKNQKIRKNRNLQTSNHVPLAGPLSGKVQFKDNAFTAHFNDVQAENSVLGIPVYHTHKKGLSKNGVGKNYSLNLHETFKKENGDYVYTDGNGKNHTFNEYYYYVNENKERVFVENKSDIVIELDGSLKYNNHEVFADYVSDVELKVATDHSDFIGVHLFEKRTDEHKQLQEQVDGHKKALEDFVIFDKTNMSVVKTGTEITEFLANGTLSTAVGTNLLLTQNERFQYESLINQLESGRIQATSIGRQITLTNRTFPLVHFMPSTEIQYAEGVISSSTNVTIYAKLASVMYSIHEINMLLKALCDRNTGLSNTGTILSCIVENDYIPNTVYSIFNLNYFYYLSNNADDKITGSEVQNKIKQRNLLVSQYKELVSELSIQRQSLTAQELNVNDMRQIANMQKNHLIAISAYNCEQAQKYYKNYINLKFKLDEIEKQTPVNYLSDGTIIKGYNANGNLVAIYDNQQNYAVVEYEKYRISDDEQGERISRLVDNNEKAVILNYSEKGLLKSITDVFGNRTAYEYDSDNNLTKIIAPDGSQTTIEYYVDDNIITVCDSNKSKALLTFNNDHLEKVTYYSLFSSIDNNGITSNNMIADELNITFSMNSSYENYADFAFDKKTDRFILTNDGKACGHYVEENGLVAQAETYNFTPYYENGEKQPNPHYTVNRTRKEDLNRYSLSDFYFYLTAQETEQSTLNEYHDPVQTTITGVKLTPGDNGNTQTTTINYVYDENNRLTKKTTTISTNALIGDHSEVTNISYNEKGNVVKTESYVINPDGNEDRTLGRNVEEFVYDEQGRQIKSCKYNTLDSTSKFYNEVCYDEKSNESELDERGENATEYEYLNGAVSVKKLPNGSKFAYGYDNNGNLTAISHSTATGEENGTQRSYNCGLATQLRSGNNKINYTYDHKKRVKKISLNNIDNYVNIEYNENIDDTNSDLVITTNALGETTYVLTDNTTGNIVNVTNNDDVIQNFTYDGRNRLSSITETKDESTIRTFTYGYDDLNRKTSYAESGKYSEQYTYNANGQLATKTTSSWGNTTYTYNYKTDSTLALDSVDISSIYAKVKPLTDAMGRNKGKEILNASGTKFAEEKIAYLKVGDHATSLPSTVTYGNYVNGNYVVGENIKYSYDSMGNIVKVFENGVL
ncbi:MAG: RHS repeat protein, partial [Clostridia bacterium]|nr:RHS repeat protein [Clostridia bacterium]